MRKWFHFPSQVPFLAVSVQIKDSENRRVFIAKRFSLKIKLVSRYLDRPISRTSFLDRQSESVPKVSALEMVDYFLDEIEEN